MFISCGIAAASKRSRRRRIRSCIFASIFDVRPFSQSSARGLLLKLPIMLFDQCKRLADYCQQLAYMLRCDKRSAYATASLPNQESRTAAARHHSATAKQQCPSSSPWRGSDFNGLRSLTLDSSEVCHSYNSLEPRIHFLRIVSPSARQGAGPSSRGSRKRSIFGGGVRRAHATLPRHP